MEGVVVVLGLAGEQVAGERQRVGPRRQAGGQVDVARPLEQAGAEAGRIVDVADCVGDAGEGVLGEPERQGRVGAEARPSTASRTGSTPSDQSRTARYSTKPRVRVAPSIALRRRASSAAGSPLPAAAAAISSLRRSAGSRSASSRIRAISASGLLGLQVVADRRERVGRRPASAAALAARAAATMCLQKPLSS